MGIIIVDDVGVLEVSQIYDCAYLLAMCSRAAWPIALKIVCLSYRPQPSTSLIDFTLFAVSWL